MKKIAAIALVMMFVLTGMAMAETLKMGTNASFPPYEYYDDETGKIVGIDAEVGAAIAEKLGYDFEIVDMDFDAIIPAVTTGKVDFGMAGMTVNRGSPAECGLLHLLRHRYSGRHREGRQPDHHRGRSLR